MVKEIQCAEGKTALVDDEDYPLLSRFTWSVVGTYPCFWHHIQRRANGSTHIQMHKLIMGGINLVDHKDGNHFNNQKDNLRPVTRQLNGWNARKPIMEKRPCTSQFKGVRKEIRVNGKVVWCAYFKHVEKGEHKSTGKIIWIGRFDSEVEAAKAYNREIVKYRGEFAWVNPIPDEQIQTS